MFPQCIWQYITLIQICIKHVIYIFPILHVKKYKLQNGFKISGRHFGICKFTADIHVSITQRTGD